MTIMSSQAAINQRIDKVYKLYENDPLGNGICSLKDYLIHTDVFDSRFSCIINAPPVLRETLVAVEKTEATARCFFANNSSKHYIAIGPSLFQQGNMQISKFILMHECYHVIKFLKNNSFFTYLLSKLGINTNDEHQEEIDADKFAAQYSTISELVSALKNRLDENDCYTIERLKVISALLGDRLSTIKMKRIITRALGKEIKSIEDILQMSKVRISQNNRVSRPS